MKALAAIFWISVIFQSGAALADCANTETEICTKVHLVSIKYDFWGSAFRLKSTCDVEFEEIESKEKREVITIGCPALQENDYVYLKKYCRDIDRGILALIRPAKLVIMSEAQCLPILAKRKEKKEYLEKIKSGMMINDLKNFELERTGVSVDGIVWTFKTPFNFEVKIQMIGEKCDGVVCLDPSVQRVDKVLSIVDKQTFD